MKNIFHLILSFTLFSCVDAIVVDNVNNANLLIVEGRISSEVGPHKIRLSRSANYGDVFSGEITGEPGASIFIRDNLGNTEKVMDADGTYDQHLIKLAKYEIKSKMLGTYTNIYGPIPE